MSTTSAPFWSTADDRNSAQAQGLRIQPKREFGGRKRKEMKRKRLSFPFISFSESALFKGLRAIKIKKSGSLSIRVSGCGERAQLLLLLRTTQSAELDSINTYL
jgi:hypothetical protein